MYCRFKLRVTALVLISTILTLTACAFYDNDQAVEFIQKYYASISTNNFVATTQSLVPELRDVITPKNVELQYLAIKDCEGIRELDISFRDSSDETLHATARLQFNGPCPAREDWISVRRENGTLGLANEKLFGALPAPLRTEYSSVDPESAATRQYGFLQTGDLVFNKGEDLVARLILGMTDSPRFSHVGIIIVRGNTEFVLNAMPNSGVTMDRLNDFMRRKNTAFFRYKTLTTDQQRLMAVFGSQQVGTRFDMALRMSEKSTTYCTKLVLQTFQAANINLAANVQSTRISSFPEPVYLPDNIWNVSDLQEITSDVMAPNSKGPSR